MRRRLRDFLRPIDAKLILALTALIVTVTVCYGFVQRGDHITSAEKSVTTLTHQVDQLLDENRDLHDQLQRIERRSMRREHAAAKDRELLSRELLRLTEWLRANGIRVPAATYRPTVQPSAPAATTSPQGGSQVGQGGSGGGGNPGGNPGGPDNPAQGNGAAVTIGPDGVSIDLPGDLPDIRLP